MKRWHKVTTKPLSLMHVNRTDKPRSCHWVLWDYWGGNKRKEKSTAVRECPTSTIFLSRTVSSTWLASKAVSEFISRKSGCGNHREVNEKSRWKISLSLLFFLSLQICLILKCINIFDYITFVCLSISISVIDLLSYLSSLLFVIILRSVHFTNLSQFSRILPFSADDVQGKR